MAESKKVVLKELSNTLLDQEVLNKQKDKLEERIMTKLNSLGVKVSNYSEAVIKASGIRDKYGDVFAKIEDLMHRRDIIVKELDIIAEIINYVGEKMKDSKVIEYKVFDLHYFEGLTLQEIAKREKYSIDRIKQVSANISKKFAVNSKITP